MSSDTFLGKAGESFLAALRRVFGSRNERILKELWPVVEEINALDPEIRGLSDEELRGKTGEFRNRLSSGEMLDNLLVEAFAVAREAADRRIGICSIFKPEHEFDPSRLKHGRHRELCEQGQKRVTEGAKIAELMLPASLYDEVREIFPEYRPPFRMRPFDVQLLGGIVLHQGKIAEMVTGEGKTLVATLPAYLNALPETHVHIVTVNDYLARRDRDWNSPMLEALGLTIGAIQAQQTHEDKREAYACDITYGTNNEFGFDYLRDNMQGSIEEQVQGQLHYAIIDEVDNILIDEARTPLIISGPAEESTEKYYVADRIARNLRKGVHFEIKEKEHSAHLTEEGVEAVERALGVDSIYTPQHMEWPHHIEQALRAHHLYKRDVDYVAKGGEIVIVDDFTGRLMEGRRWSDGLHQAAEAKERLRIREENQTLATITFQNFFRLYDKLAGMTGTAITEATEFDKIYKLDVVVVPTNMPLARMNFPDVVFRTEQEKWNAIEEEIVEVNATGRPILVGTISIESSEMLGTRLQRRGIEHEVLNAKQHAREAVIVAKSGQLGHVTIATNMAGRGTDIVLGEGVPEIGGVQTIPSLGAWNKLIDMSDGESETPQPVHWRVLALDEHGEVSYSEPSSFRFGEEPRVEPGEQPAPPSPEELKPPEDGELTILFPERGRAFDPNRRMPPFAWRAGPNFKRFQVEFSCDSSFDGGSKIVRYPWAIWDRKPRPIGSKAFRGGGLHIVGTERHEARRIDNQLRGRAGRQGDPGSSRFFLSLEDDLMRIFASERVSALLKRFGMEEGMAIEHGMVTRSIGRAQRKVEEHNFEIRKNLLEYDEVMDEQRKTTYGWRQQVLEGRELREMMLNMITECLQDAIDTYLPPKVHLDEWDHEGLTSWFETKFGRRIEISEDVHASAEETENLLLEEIKKAYDEREQNIGSEAMRELERCLLLDRIDSKWKDHLYAMDQVKSGIGLRGYGQVDPKIEYKKEALSMFEQMAGSIRDEASDFIFKVEFQPTEGMHRSVWNVSDAVHHEYGGFDEARAMAAAADMPDRPEPIRVDPKVGRNSPCPCGSGKKYKRCCGR